MRLKQTIYRFSLHFSIVKPFLRVNILIFFIKYLATDEFIPWENSLFLATNRIDCQELSISLLKKYICHCGTEEEIFTGSESVISRETLRKITTFDEYDDENQDLGFYFHIACFDDNEMVVKIILDSNVPCKLFYQKITLNNINRLIA